MLTISPTSFKSDYVQSSSMFNQKNNMPPAPMDYGDDSLELLTLQKDMQKKQNKQEKMNKLLTYSSVGIAIGLLGSLLFNILTHFRGGASALDKITKGAQNINYKDVTNEKSFEELCLSKEMQKVVDDLKTTIERAEWLKKKGGEGGSGIMLYGEPGGGKNAYVYALTKYLQKLFPDQILEVRGRGFMLGLLLNFEASNLVQDMLKNCNVITNATSGNVLRIVPPLIIDLEEIDLFVESLKSCLSKQK